MATADVLVLRSLRSDDGAPGAAPAGDRGGSGGGATGSSRGSDATTSSGGGSWPASWLPGLLARTHGGPEDDSVDRHRRAHLLRGSRCRYIDVTASPSDPTAVRLTLVWQDEAPSAEDRAAFVSWWLTQAAAHGWEPSETDELVGSVVAVRHLPTDLARDLTSSPSPDATPGTGAAVLPQGAAPQDDPGEGSRTSGRRT